MGKHMGISLVLIFLLFFLPWLWGEPTAGDQEEPPPEQTEEPEEQSPPPVTAEDAPQDSAVSVRVLAGGEVREMSMAEYLAGVVRAEMPASFAQEALKAQAVAARTYTYYKIENGGSGNHPEADACDDITCCQAYKTYEAAAQDWGAKAAEYEAKIRTAVAETDGQCVLYEGQPVLAVFHSSAAGMTQDAADVWSGSLPYLKSVQSPEDADTVPNYHSTASFQAGELKELLQAELPEADLSGSPSNWFTNMKQQTNGTVTSLRVGGAAVSGNQLRTILGLRSACFTISFEGDQVTFSVTGYGHGVGMSQYGANVLASDGMTYQEILAWYYTDTAVGTYSLQKDRTA